MTLYPGGLSPKIERKNTRYKSGWSGSYLTRIIRNLSPGVFEVLLPMAEIVEGLEE